MKKLAAPRIFELLKKGYLDKFSVSRLPEHIERDEMELAPHCAAKPIVDSMDYSLLHVLCASSEQKGLIGLFDRLIELGAPINLPAGYTRNAPIHVAAIWGRSWSVHRLLDLGVPVNLLNLEGKTPLHYAGSVGAIDLFAELVARGADPEIVDIYGHSAFDCGNHSVSLRLRQLHASYLANRDIDASMVVVESLVDAPNNCKKARLSL